MFSRGSTSTNRGRAERLLVRATCSRCSHAHVLVPGGGTTEGPLHKAANALQKKQKKQKKTAITHFSEKSRYQEATVQ